MQMPIRNKPVSNIFAYMLNLDSPLYSSKHFSLIVTLQQFQDFFLRLFKFRNREFGGGFRRLERNAECFERLTGGDATQADNVVR